ncbi:hypothetical protein BpHYR1_031213 [Brachionus plicatilis]|uniref:Uncharacterized protein n=1 Tax=Brachionus plicatilis TaxID=10195 RepID=A0A3M7Q939_BRAPC|nr:hypothetical protein BpHYR1_031213 [Brachionus plicatilis]
MLFAIRSLKSPSNMNFLPFQVVIVAALNIPLFRQEEIFLCVNFLKEEDFINKTLSTKNKIVYVKALLKILIQKNIFKSRILDLQYTLIVRLYSSSRLLHSLQ